jgi:YgiT-type zinc finger domain-containing protein
MSDVEMECLHCKGKMVRKKVSYTVNRKGYHLVIDDVPAWVCEQCGEPLFEEETVNLVQEMLRAVDARMERLAVTLATA